MSTAFDTAFRFTIGEEGKLSLDPKDPGNWTSGHCGVGELKGTKFGVSARAYPNVDIANLSLADAKAIANANYWLQIKGDFLPAPVSFQVFDTAYNQGVTEAKRVLQQALGVTVDCVFGPKTMLAAEDADQHELAQLFREFRIEAYKKDDRFPEYGHGWVDRANTCCEAAEKLI
jgi:lysozyme family protein